MVGVQVGVLDGWRHLLIPDLLTFYSIMCITLQKKYKCVVITHETWVPTYLFYIVWEWKCLWHAPFFLIPSLIHFCILNATSLMCMNIHTVFQINLFKKAESFCKIDANSLTFYLAILLLISYTLEQLDLKHCT